MSLALTQLQAATEDFWEKGVSDIYFMDNVILWKLMGKGKMGEELVSPGELVDGGTMIRVPLEYGKANVSSYGSSTTINATPALIVNAARFPWAGYVAWNSINLDEQVQNAGAEAVVDLAFTKLRNMQKTIRDEMGSDIYLQDGGDADANAFDGLGNLFLATTSTAYGSIAEDDMATWKANAITTSEAISFKVLQAMRRTASVGQNAGDKPDLYVTTELLKDGYERTLQTQARYSDTDLVNAGFANVLFGGAPVVADDKQTTGYCDALNLKYLKIKTHRDYAFTKPVWKVFAESAPDTLVANTRWIGQLVCSNRKAHCRHTNLSDPT